MQFSWEWLGEYVELGDDLEAVAQALTDAGLAVELVEEVGEDRVLDIDITTNRPDCMNYVGLAREVAALRGVPLRQPVAGLPTPQPGPDHDVVTIEVPELCRRFAGQVIGGVTVGESPDWLKRRLEAIGLRPISNIVDITNYVLWETGQPLHAFDFDTLIDRRLVVRQATAGERLTTLDGEERTLDETMVVVADGARAVALAGVMGGLDTEVTDQTTTILLEGAWWDPSSVRRTSKELGMHTDASHRFERGSDPEACRAAIERATALVLELAGGQLLGKTIDVRGTEHGPIAPIELSHDRLERFAGVEIPRPEVEERLKAIGFDLRPHSEGWMVEPPSWRRFDVVEAADCYEEVLRLIGFDRVPAALPPSEGPDAPEIPIHALRRQLRDRLAAAGYAEVINYGFYGAAQDALLPPLFGDRPALAVENPLSELYHLMRRNLLAGVVENARFNRRRNQEAVQLFEFGHVFWRTADREPKEREHVALVLGGRLGTPWERQLEFDLFDLKGAVELLAETGGVELVARPATISGLLPGVAAELTLNDEVVGILGELDEPAGEAYPLLVAELWLDSLLPQPEPPKVEVPPRHPGVAVDFTLTHPLDVSFASISAAIEESATPDLSSFWLEGRYQGQGVPSGAVNTTIHFEYNASDRSLTQEEVNERQKLLSDQLIARFGVGGTAS